MSIKDDSGSIPESKKEYVHLDDIEEPSTEAKYIAIYRKAHPEIEANEKKLEIDAKKKLFYFKPTKLTGFSAKRVEHTYFDDNGKKFAFIQERRQRPYNTEVRILPRGKKNPDKQVLASIGEFPHKSQIFQYINQEDYIYLSNGVDIVRLERKDCYKLVLQLLGATMIDKSLEEDLSDADLWLQIFSKSQLPHLKLRDWRKEHKIITLSPEQLDKEFVENIRDKEDERKSFGDYHKRKSMT